MALSPNAGTDYYIIDCNNVVHNLKNETEDCRILAYFNEQSCLNHSYSNLVESAVFKGILHANKCPYCFKD